MCVSGQAFTKTNIGGRITQENSKYQAVPTQKLDEHSEVERSIPISLAEDDPFDSDLRHANGTESQSTCTSEIVEDLVVRDDLDDVFDGRTPVKQEGDSLAGLTKQTSLKLQSNQTHTKSYTSFASFEDDSNSEGEDVNSVVSDEMVLLTDMTPISNTQQIEVKTIVGGSKKEERTRKGADVGGNNQGGAQSSTATAVKINNIEHSQSPRFPSPKTWVSPRLFWTPINIHPLESNRMRRGSPTVPRQRSGALSRSYTHGSSYQRVGRSSIPPSGLGSNRNAGENPNLQQTTRNGVIYVPLAVKTISADDVFGPAEETQTHAELMARFLQKGMKTVENLSRKSPSPPHGLTETTKRTCTFQVDSDLEKHTLVRSDSDERPEAAAMDASQRPRAKSSMKRKPHIWNSIMTQSLPMVILTDEGEDDKVLLSGREAEVRADERPVLKTQGTISRHVGTPNRSPLSFSRSFHLGRPHSAPPPSLHRRISCPGSLPTANQSQAGKQGQRSYTKPGSQSTRKQTISRKSFQEKQQGSLDSQVSTEDEMDEQGFTLKGHTLSPRPKSAHYRRRMSRTSLLKQDSWDEEEVTDALSGGPRIVVSYSEPQRPLVGRGVVLNETQQDMVHEVNSFSDGRNHISMLQIPEWHLKSEDEDSDEEGATDEGSHH